MFQQVPSCTHSTVVQQDFLVQPPTISSSPSLDSIYSTLNTTSSPSLYDPPQLNDYCDCSSPTPMQLASPVPISPVCSPSSPSTFFSASPCSSPSSPSPSKSIQRRRGKRPTDHTGTFQRAVQQVIKREGHILAWRKFRAQRKGVARTHEHDAHVCTVKRAPCIKGYIAFCARMGNAYAGLLRDARYQNLGSRTECQCPNPFGL